MNCQGYGSILSSLTLILCRQGHSQSGSSLLPSEKGTSFFDGPVLSTGISLTEIFHLGLLLSFFSMVSWLSMPTILSWALPPDPNALRADSEARVLLGHLPFYESAVYPISHVGSFSPFLILSVSISRHLSCLCDPFDS